MIKLFRNIRKNILQEGKTTKYFKYAIGEIILVVAGILIALSINNWNEARKERVVEVQMLKNIKSSLQSDIDNQINPSLEQALLDLKNIEHIKQFLKHNEIYNDSMNLKFNTLMYSKNFDYEVTSYKALENEGLQLVQNPELKSRILKLYNMTYPELQFRISNFMNNVLSFFRPNMRELFWFLDNNRENGYKPINYEDLRNNTDFKNNLVACTENCEGIYKSNITIKKEVETLIEMIDKELDEEN